MDTILQLYSQDATGTVLREYFEDADTTFESVDHISNLVAENLRELESNGTHEQEPRALTFVRAVVRASSEDGAGAARRLQVLKGAVTWLLQAGNDSASPSGGNSTQLDELAGKLVNTLIDVGQSFPVDALVQSINAITETIRQQRHPNSSTFELFSRLLVIAANADTVNLPDSHEEITGVEFRDFILDRICTAPWNPKSVLPLATVLGDVDMESRQLEMAIVKVMKQFKHIDATDLPHLIYNLLLLSSKGHQRLVLRGILEFFDRLDAGGEMAECLHSDNPRGASRLGFSELSAVQSTVILHFSFAVKQDQELGTELLKHMKSGKLAFLSPFSLMCLLTMARVHRFEDNVVDYLKLSILSIFKDEERTRKETWVTHNNVPKRTKLKPTDYACELGAAILAETFKTQESVRTEILDHIMSRVVTKSASTMYFLNLLETIVKESSEALIEHLPRVKESLDYLSFLSLSTAVRLMAAVKDVAAINRPFRDSLLLILRKALFSKCLGQQGDIRLSLYIGLMSLVESSPALLPIVFEILQAHFVHFYDKTGTRLAPLKLDECVANARTGGEPSLIEPLQFLMSGVVRSLVDAIGVDNDLVEDFQNDLYKLVLGLERTGLEDFELDKTSDFHMASNIGVRNNMYASLLIGCFESSIEYLVLRLQTQPDQSSNGKATMQASTEVLKNSDYDYCRRLSSVLVREFLTSVRPDGPRALAAGVKGKDKNKSMLMAGIEALTAGLLIVQRFYPLEAPGAERQDPATISTILHNTKVVCGFLAATLPQVNGGHQPDQQPSEVVAWTTSRTIKHDVDSLAAAYCQFLQGLLEVFVNETLPQVKEAAGILTMIQILSKYLARPTISNTPVVTGLSRTDSTTSTDSAMDTSQLDQLIHWLIRVCRDLPIDDATLAKTLLSMTLSLEQEGSSPEENAALMAINDGGQPESSRQPQWATSGASVSSVVSNCPKAATRLRLAADILVTYNMNHGPGIQSIPDRIDPAEHEEQDEEMPRLVALKREIGVESRFSVVTMRTASSTTDVLLTHVEEALDSLEWTVGKLRYCELSQSQGSVNLNQAMDVDAASSSSSVAPRHTIPPLNLKSAQNFEADICWRLEVCIWVLARIAQACIPNTAAEYLIKILSRCYKVLTTLTKHYLNPLSLPAANLFESTSGSLAKKGSHPGKNRSGSSTGGNNYQLPHGFLRVTEVVGTELSKHVYNFLTYFQAMDNEVQERNFARQNGPKKKGDKGKANKGKDDENDIGQEPVMMGGGTTVKSRQKAKILRESKLIPDLIYMVEQYERYVIQLSKKSKVNLTQYLRRSTARDFKIQIQRLGDLGLEDRYEEEQQMQQLQRQAQAQALDEEVDEEEEESLVRSRKRARH
ncbi:hypothetical protein BG000_001552 [Podila horticola]|nr:hypothetical protein BG000_001552 [Podila horticola]